jgi:hypothetical protein
MRAHDVDTTSYFHSERGEGIPGVSLNWLTEGIRPLILAVPLCPGAFAVKENARLPLLVFFLYKHTSQFTDV